MAKVILLVSRVDIHKGPQSNGDVIEVGDDEAARMVAAGQADWVTDEQVLTDFESMTVAQLRTVAKEAGISYSGLSKDELIEALSA